MRQIDSANQLNYGLDSYFMSWCSRAHFSA
jgi:hypothetical protein